MRRCDTLSLPENVEQVLRCLEENGFEAWCVGGCVRDHLLGMEPSDWDVTTNALPEEMKVCFAAYRTVDTGIRHGTVTVITEDGPIEVTTYRSDGEYLDHRHPETVTFSRDLRDDLSRRDFTINAMAYHPRRGLVDAFGGEADLEAGVLRCVGEPERRFEEDALRILRCLRFAARLGFAIHPGTAAALRTRQGLLLDIAPERVREELNGLLCGDHAGAILREYSDVLFTVLPELAPMKGCAQETPYHCYDVWEHTLRMLSGKDAVLQWARLLHDCGKPAVKSYDEAGTAHFYGHIEKSAQLSGTIMERLHFSNREKEEILTLIQLHGEPCPIPEPRLKKLLGRQGEDRIRRLLRLLQSDLLAQAEDLSAERGPALRETELLLEKILAERPCLTLSELSVNGNDLLALGFPKGPKIGEALQTLLDLVLKGSLPNEKAVLLQWAEERLKR